jgi:excinuclease UvrABC nuclease subunit
MNAYLESQRREMPAGEFESAPNVPAVFLIWADEGAPYLARTGMLGRRLRRLLREPARTSRLLNLRGVARRIEWYPAASRLESSYLLYLLARLHFPDTYQRIVKLRNPPFVRVTLGNRFPRTSVSSSPGGGRSLHFGPFRSRASAEAFENQVLDLFQVRRCQEDLEPSPDHPGCMYGEMNMCLRPCQCIVGPEEYAAEVKRLTSFLSSGGDSLVESITAARDRCSDEMLFEDAARQHKRLQKVEDVLKLRDELACDIDQLNGIGVTRAAEDDAVLLWILSGGVWHEPVVFPLVQEGRPVSLDHRLRETMASLPPLRVSSQVRREHIALLAKWFYSSWRDGEWIHFAGLAGPPYRRIVNAIARVAKAVQAS